MGWVYFVFLLCKTEIQFFSCWWVRGWETPLPHKINQSKIGVSILAGREGQGATSALSGKVNVAEPLANCSSAVPRGKEPNLSLLVSSFIPASDLCHLAVSPWAAHFISVLHQKTNGTETGTGRAKPSGSMGCGDNLLAQESL